MGEVWSELGKVQDILVLYKIQWDGFWSKSFSINLFDEQIYPNWVIIGPENELFTLIEIFFFLEWFIVHMDGFFKKFLKQTLKNTYL